MDSLGLCRLEEVACLRLKLGGDFALNIADPFIVARKELTIFLLISLQGVKGIACIALLIRLQVLRHVVPHEALDQVQFKVVLFVKVMTSHRFYICVVIVRVATIGKRVEKLLLSLEFKLGENSLLKIHGYALNSFSDLHKCLGLNTPSSRVVL